MSEEEKEKKIEEYLAKVDITELIDNLDKTTNINRQLQDEYFAQLYKWYKIDNRQVS